MSVTHKKLRKITFTEMSFFSNDHIIKRNVVTEIGFSL